MGRRNEAEYKMRFKEIFEGGWDSTVTQGTVIHPSTVKIGLAQVQTFVQGFNQWLTQQGLDPVKVGSPTGSSAYHNVDDESKVYGDIDLQMIASPVTGTPSQHAAYYNKLVDQYIVRVQPDNVYFENKPTNGHVIFQVGQDAYVQVDMIWTTDKLSDWMRYRMTPERNVKGLITGNMYSSLGEILGLSIQHSGVQLKIKNEQPINYQRGRKEDRIETLTTDISRFAYDLLVELHKRISPETELQVSPRLVKHPGLNKAEVKISDLAQAIRGLAESFELNSMYGRHVLSNFVDQEDFIQKFLTHYIGKANDAASATKFDKAETPDAIARAKDTKDKIVKGVELVTRMFEQ